MIAAGDFVKKIGAVHNEFFVHRTLAPQAHLSAICLRMVHNTF
jgi:hypothetical protein